MGKAQHLCQAGLAHQQAILGLNSSKIQTFHGQPEPSLPEATVRILHSLDWGIERVFQSRKRHTREVREQRMLDWWGVSNYAILN